MTTSETELSYSKPAAATLCTDSATGNQVDSCTIGAVSCDTSASGSSTDFAGTYEINSDGNLVYTLNSPQACNSGQEVRTYSQSSN